MPNRFIRIISSGKEAEALKAILPNICPNAWTDVAGGAETVFYCEYVHASDLKVAATLWNNRTSRPLTVREVMEAATSRMTHNTVLSAIRRLEKKGIIAPDAVRIHWEWNTIQEENHVH